MTPINSRVFEFGIRFHNETYDDRNAVERVFQEAKRLIEPFYDTFSHRDTETAEPWLRTSPRFDGRF